MLITGGILIENKQINVSPPEFSSDTMQSVSNLSLMFAWLQTKSKNIFFIVQSSVDLCLIWRGPEGTPCPVSKSIHTL